ncbi:MAG: DUF4832 domain-containing protein [Monoglobaceae bacterium]
MLIKKDLTGLWDTRSVLKNPHKGWYWHYVDNGLSMPKYRDCGADGIGKFPGLNHLYLRVDWSDIQTEKDVFDWSEIDRVMEKWGAKGYNFALRVCCCEGPAQKKFASPEWLYNMGCGGKFHPPSYEENPDWWDKFQQKNYSSAGTPEKLHRAWEPDYGDPLFVEYLEKFLMNYAEKYDGDPRIEYIDVGSYGTWGEGHTWAASHCIWPVEVLKKHVLLHMKYFKTTPVMMNDDMINNAVNPGEKPVFVWEGNQAVLREKNADIRRDFADFCQALGMGLRDDSILVGNKSDGPYDTVRSPELFRQFSGNGIIDIESEHYANISPECFKDGFVLMEALKNCCASFAGFHGYPEEFLEKHYPLCEYAANRLGYWYFIRDVLYYDKFYAGTVTEIEMTWINKGFAACGRRYSLVIMLSGIENTQQYLFEAEEFDSRKIMPEKEYKFKQKIMLPDNIKSGVYVLSVKLCERIKEEEKIIKLGLDAKYMSGGFYRITEVEIVNE